MLRYAYLGLRYRTRLHNTQILVINKHKNLLNFFSINIIQWIFKSSLLKINIKILLKIPAIFSLKPEKLLYFRHKVVLLMNTISEKFQTFLWFQMSRDIQQWPLSKKRFLKYAFLFSPLNPSCRRHHSQGTSAAGQTRKRLHRIDSSNQAVDIRSPGKEPAISRLLEVSEAKNISLHKFSFSSTFFSPRTADTKWILYLGESLISWRNENFQYCIPLSRR